jgi:hypothetical protein
MTQQIINVGATSNDGTGDKLRYSMQKVNANFTDLYSTSYASNVLNTFNTRSGTVTLLSADVNGALGYTPYSSTGGIVSGAVTIGSTAASTSTTTGALIVAGGAGVAGAINSASVTTSLLTVTGNIDISTIGAGLKVAEGSNAKQGVATLSSGTVLVSNTSVTATSRIQLTAQDNNSTGALRVSARTPFTSFTITSSNGSDSGVVAYEIFEQG